MSNVSVDFEAEEVLVVEVNDNGQIYLGRDLAGERIRVGFEIVDEDE